MERSNTYIFIYSIIMVVLVAAILSITAYSLKGLQTANVQKEKMQNILASIHINVEAQGAEENYKKYIIESFLIDKNNQKLPYVLKTEMGITDTITAFDIDMKKMLALSKSERTLPMFIAEKDGERYSIIPLLGKGLWGPVWGYVSLHSDNNTVYGAVFDHQGETPGLGAEINTDKFQKNFDNKKIFDENNSFKSIKVVKGGVLPSDNHAVDGISGGTITSKGVSDMLDTCLIQYVPFFESLSNK